MEMHTGPGMKVRKVCDSLGYFINNFNELLPVPVYKTEKIKGKR